MATNSGNVIEFNALAAFGGEEVFAKTVVDQIKIKREELKIDCDMLSKACNLGKYLVRMPELSFCPPYMNLEDQGPAKGSEHNWHEIEANPALLTGEVLSIVSTFLGLNIDAMTHRLIIDEAYESLRGTAKSAKDQNKNLYSLEAAASEDHDSSASKINFDDSFRTFLYIAACQELG